MKTNRMISMLFCAGILLGSSGTMQAMDPFEEEALFTEEELQLLLNVSNVEQVIDVQQVITEEKIEQFSDVKVKTPTEYSQFLRRKRARALLTRGGAIAGLAAVLGITIARAGYLIKAYGFKVMYTALNYPRISVNQFNLLILKNAYQHNDEALKQDLLALNARVFGDDFGTKRDQIIKDYRAMSWFKFRKKYSAGMYSRVTYLLEIYGAAADLYFNKIKWYFPTKVLIEEMEQLDKYLGIK